MFFFILPFNFTYLGPMPSSTTLFCLSSLIMLVALYKLNKTKPCAVVAVNFRGIAEHSCR